MGGGLAAARTAEQLRRSEYTGPITIVSDEEHLPYDRPPLSKEVLRAETDDVTLKPAEFYDENDITVLLGKAARSIDTDAQTLKLADGSELAYDELIIATGLVPKRIPSFPDLPGIHVLRSFDESLKLRGEAGAARQCGRRRRRVHRLRGGGQPARPWCRRRPGGAATGAARVGAR